MKPTTINTEPIYLDKRREQKNKTATDEMSEYNLQKISQFSAPIDIINNLKRYIDIVNQISEREDSNIDWQEKYNGYRYYSWHCRYGYYCFDFKIIW